MRAQDVRSHTTEVNVKNLYAWSAALLLLLLTSAAGAACSDAKVKQLHKSGRTIAAIATQCDMEKSDVRSVVDDDDGGGDDDDLLQNGAQLMECGCHGAVAVWAVRPEPRCASGVARPRPCRGYCPLGGSPWADYCAAR
jgi:hypothetical protein